MVNKKIKMNEKNSNGTYNTLHPETTIEQVINPSTGQNIVEHFLDTTKKHIEIVDEIPTNLEGKGIFFKKEDATLNTPDKPITFQEIYTVIGNMDSLTTSQKTSLVAAINSLKSTMDQHANDAVQHITSAERTAWNEKTPTSIATTSSNGLMSSADKTKLNGVATNANNYTHPANHPASIIIQDADNRFVTDMEKATWNEKTPTSIATTSSNGLMSSSDKTKLNGIAANANNYTHPTSHPASIIIQDANNRFVSDAEKSIWNEKTPTSTATANSNGLMSSGDKTKLDGIATNANNYTHPSNHPASIITQDTNNRFVTDAEKATWNEKAPNSTATTSVSGLMSSADKTKLNGIATGANNYTHPANHPASIIIQDTNNRFVTDAEKTTWNASSSLATTSVNGLMSSADKTKLNGIAASANNYTHPTNHPASIITQDANNRFVSDIDIAKWNTRETSTGAQAKVDIHANDYTKHEGIARTSGTGSVYDVTLAPAPTAYVEGMGLVLSIHASSIMSPSVNVNGLGGRALRNADGTSVSDLRINGVYTFRYSTTTNSFILQGGMGSGSDYVDGTVIIYVNNNGSDTNDGKSAATAVKTIAKAVELVKRVNAKDREIKLAEYQVFNEVVDLSGIHGNRLTFNGTYNARATVKGFRIEDSTALIRIIHTDIRVIAPITEVYVYGAYILNCPLVHIYYGTWEGVVIGVDVSFSKVSVEYITFNNVPGSIIEADKSSYVYVDQLSGSNPASTASTYNSYASIITGRPGTVTTPMAQRKGTGGQIFF
ncbi:hypothetical protein NSQ62_07715 [Solibacillus sp. FSL H8-0523]|uniref:hypothetical protein n=1 Tax=Solibacillus sp. FSL H8-0523 TaxID=2954511 RepID=UPI0031019301